MNVLSYGFSVFTLDCPKPASRWRFARVSIVEKILLLLQVLSYLDLAAMDNSLIKMVQMIQWAQSYKKNQPKNHKKPPKTPQPQPKKHHQKSSKFCLVTTHKTQILQQISHVLHYLFLKL